MKRLICPLELRLFRFVVLRDYGELLGAPAGVAIGVAVQAGPWVLNQGRT